MIHIGDEKTKQTLCEAACPQYVNANPEQRDICPILSLGIFFVAVDNTLLNGEFLNSGRRQGCRVDKIIKEW